MKLIEALLRKKSCSVTGMEKNTGKTVTLNYLLRHLPPTVKVAVTSIGLDGESKDQVTGTHKPEISLRNGMIFATSEKHYRTRHLVSELLDVSTERTALGRLVTARVLTEGKVMLSGPGATQSIARWMKETEGLADLTLIDGALSRLSLASPTVSESMILATGAAYSANSETLVRNTAYVVELMNLPLTDIREETLQNTEEESDFLILDGAVTNRIIENILNDKNNIGKEIIIQDFTKVFADMMLWHRFVKNHTVSVRSKSELIAITVNPVAPNGMKLHSDKICELLRQAVNVPVYDLVEGIVLE